MTTFLWWKKSLTEVQVLLSALRYFKAPALFKELWTIGAGGGTPYNDLCGWLLLKGVATFFRFQGCEREGVSLVNGYEREGAVISVCEKDLKGPVDAFYGCKRDKKTFWFNTFKKTVHLLHLKGMQYSERSMRDGYHLLPEGYERGRFSIKNRELKQR